MKYIDITPTWEQIMPLLLTVVTEGETATARESAWNEILRCARIADQCNKSQNDGSA